MNDIIFYYPVQDSNISYIDYDNTNILTCTGNYNLIYF